MNFDWHNCYSEGWQNEIVPEAFSHPAKFSRALIRRIYAHALERGYLREGQTVLDPFGGVALGALDAMFHGLHYIGCELEDKFVQLGQQNIDLWNRRYSTMPRWGTAVILQGDSRKLVEVLEGARVEGMISSPPYATQTVHDRCGVDPDKLTGNPPGPHSQALTMANYGDSDGQLGAMREGDAPADYAYTPGSLTPTQFDVKAVTESITFTTAPKREEAVECEWEEEGVDGIISSPPWTSTEGSHSAAKFRDPEGSAECRAEGYRSGRLKGHGASKEAILRAMQKANQSTYGTSDGQLAALPEGEPPQVDGLVSSPPYAKSISADGHGIDWTKVGPATGNRRRGEGTQHEATLRAQLKYGTDPDNLGNMKEGEPPQVDGLVASPPWESNLCRDGRGTNLKIHDQLEEKYHRRYGERSFPKETYGDSDGQLGTESGATFWSAARAILLQCYAILAPGGVAIWVLKAFVRNKAIVDFPGQWRALCESCGFETIEVIRAWLVEDRGAQFALNGDLVKRKVARKSFFRRLYEAKARAAEFWKSVGRDDKARHLWQAHHDLWENRRSGLPDKKPPYPTRSRILGEAQMMAYAEAGKPAVEIDTQIDWEVVLITRKAV